MSIDPNLQRRGFLKCMTWAGTAMVWTVAGGVPRSRLIGSAEAADTDFTFVQISDSHLGFDKPANPNVTATLQEALDDVGKLPKQAGLHDPHRRHHASVQAGAVRHGGAALRRHQAARCTPCPASTTSWRKTARATSTASARAPRATAGTASTPAACTSSAW